MIDHTYRITWLIIQIKLNNKFKQYIIITFYKLLQLWIYLFTRNLCNTITLVRGNGRSVFIVLWYRRIQSFGVASERQSRDATFEPSTRAPRLRVGAPYPGIQTRRGPEPREPGEGGLRWRCIFGVFSFEWGTLI